MYIYIYIYTCDMGVRVHVDFVVAQRPRPSGEVPLLSDD